MKIAIVLYDGDCNFCYKWVSFTKNKLQKNEISFIPFNSIKGLEKIKTQLLIFMMILFFSNQEQF